MSGRPVGVDGVDLGSGCVAGWAGEVMLVAVGTGFKFEAAAAAAVNANGKRGSNPGNLQEKE